MLFLCRLVFGGCMIWSIHLAIQLSNRTNMQRAELPEIGFSMAVLLVLALLNAIVWAPYIGAKIADPIAGMFTRSSFSWHRSKIYKHILRLEHKKKYKTAAWTAYFYGLMRPNEPEVFYSGMQNSVPSSYLQKYFAEKVYQFLNARRCLEAYTILKSLGWEPVRHREQSINRLIMVHFSQKRERPSKLELLSAPPLSTLARNVNITLPKKITEGHRKWT